MEVDRVIVGLSQITAVYVVFITNDNELWL
jgi:hypothetical protein